MLAQDLFEEAKMVAVDRGRALLAGLLDAAMWLAWFLSSSIAIGSEALHGWSTRTVAIVLAVTAANIIGSASGVKLGRRFIEESA